MVQEHQHPGQIGLEHILHFFYDHLALCVMTHLNKYPTAQKIRHKPLNLNNLVIQECKQFLILRRKNKGSNLFLEFLYILLFIEPFSNIFD